MKHLATLFGLILLLTAQLFSQAFDISGQVKDASSGDAILYSYVHALNESDSVVAAAVTDEKGFFSLPLKAGHYRFTFSQLGYQQDTTDFFHVSAPRFLDVFKIPPLDTELDEVLVQAKSDKYFFDRDEQIITEDLRAGTSNTYDVLDKIKGLHYDRYNDNITVDNDDKVMILVNSLEKDIEYIRNISPERLKKIEIIRSPSGKYALEGYSAVINIILKDDYKGYDFRYGNHGFANFEKYPHDPLMIMKNRLSANYSNEKYNAYMNYAYSMQGFSLPVSVSRTYADGSFQNYTAPQNLEKKNGLLTNSNHRFSGGIDRFISPKHTVSYELSYNNRPARQNVLHARYLLEDNTSGELNTNTFENYREEGNTTLNNSLFYKGKFNSRNRLDITYALSIYQGEVNNRISFDEFNTEEFVDNQRYYSVLDADYIHIISDNLQVDLGYGMVWDKRYNTFEHVTEMLSAEQSEFEYRDMRNRVYSYFTWQPTDKFTIKSGTAVEQSHVTRADANDKRNIVLPHADISWKASQMFQITLKYRANAEYPSIDQINPFGTVEMNSVLYIGNPDLEPEIRHSVSLRTNVMGGLFSAEPYYEFTDNYIISVISQDADNQLYSQFQNAGRHSRYGIKANLTIPFSKSIIFQNSADFFSESIEYNGESRSLNDWTMNSNLVYKLSKYGTTFGAMYQNQLRRYLSWEGYNYQNNDFWGVMVQQTLFQDRLNVMLLYMLPIDWATTYNQGSYTENALYTEYNTIDIEALKNMLMFRVSFRFSKGQKIRNIEKSIDLDEQQGGGLF